MFELRERQNVQISSDGDKSGASLPAENLGHLSFTVRGLVMELPWDGTGGKHRYEAEWGRSLILTAAGAGGKRGGHLRPRRFDSL